jgi:stage V sporulation protein R
LSFFATLKIDGIKVRYGKEYDDCNDLREKKRVGSKKGLGIEKIFEVRKVYNDVMFIDEFLTEDFCLKHKLFTFEYNPKTTQYEDFFTRIPNRKKKLLHSLTNRGQPFIYVSDSNFENRSELLLLHKHEGIDLKLDWASATLENLFKIWKRPVNLLTVVDEKGKILTFDGKEHKSRFTENTK